MALDAGETEHENLSKLKELLEREIAQLEERLKLLKALLKVLDSCGSMAYGSGGREFRSQAGVPVARLVERRDSVMLVSAKPIPENIPYIKYAISVLERLRAEGGLEYTIEKREKGIVSILATNLDKSVKDDVIAVFEFVANKMSELLSKGSQL